MNKYVSRITSSARGEVFNPLIWPFLWVTFVYGVGFACILPFTDAFGTSSLYVSMQDVGEHIPILWGVVAVVNIVMGLSFLLFNIPPFGKISGIIGAMVWLYASIAYAFDSNWLVLLAVSGPNGFFWVWQYFKLAVFDKEDRKDKATMKAYDDGEYDDNNGGKQLRLDNRGVDPQ